MQSARSCSFQPCAWLRSTGAGRTVPPDRQGSLIPACTVPSSGCFFWLGLGLEVVGLLGQWRLAGLVGGFRNLYLGAAGYGLEWRGQPVIYGRLGLLRALAWFEDLVARVLELILRAPTNSYVAAEFAGLL